MSSIAFGVITDLHADIVHDSARRLTAFLDACKTAQVDFAIQLGDFIHPRGIGSYTCPEHKVSCGMRNILAGRGLGDKEKDDLLALFNNAPFPTYHVMGNHDTDLYSKQEIMDFWGMEKTYYSFDRCGYHFVILDLNYGYVEGEEFSFEQGNYMTWYFEGEEPFPVLPKHQLAWLKDDLAKTDLPVVVFSHEGICPGFLNALNADEIFDVLTAHPGQVILSMYGDKHQDLMDTVRGIPCYGQNSASGYSVPPQFGAKRFDDAIEESFPNVRNMCVYQEPLFTIVTITDDTIDIVGKESLFVAPTPADIGVHFDEPTIVLTSVATSCTFQRRR